MAAVEAMSPPRSFSVRQTLGALAGVRPLVGGLLTLAGLAGFAAADAGPMWVLAVCAVVAGAIAALGAGSLVFKFGESRPLAWLWASLGILALIAAVASLASEGSVATWVTLLWVVVALVAACVSHEGVLISVAAVLFSLLLFGLFVWFSGVSVLEVYQNMYTGAFGSAFAWKNTLIRSSPLMLTALCVALPARVGMMIIGAEGCVVLGGLAAAAIAHAMPHAQPLVVIPAMMIGGVAVGGLWTMLSGGLRQLRGVNETISSLLLNYIAVALLNHFVEGPLRDPTRLDHPSSYHIGVANMLGNLPGTEIHVGFAFGVIVCVAMWILMDHTTLGFASRIVGGNPRAARVAGLSITKVSLLACFLGGGIAALAGVVEVGAVHGVANDALACGYGYAGILVAFVGRQNPLAIIPAAILLGGVAASGDSLQLNVGLSSASVQVFQGILFLVILGFETWYGRLPEAGRTLAAPFVALYRLLATSSSRKGVAHAGANA